MGVKTAKFANSILLCFCFRSVGFISVLDLTPYLLQKGERRNMYKTNKGQRNERDEKTEEKKVVVW